MTSKSRSRWRRIALPSMATCAMQQSTGLRTVLPVRRRSKKIRAAEDWRASAWILSRRFPDRWSEKRSVEVSTNDRPDGAAMVASMLAQLREEHEETGDA